MAARPVQPPKSSLPRALTQVALGPHCRWHVLLSCSASLLLPQVLPQITSLHPKHHGLSPADHRLPGAGWEPEQMASCRWDPVSSYRSKGMVSMVNSSLLAYKFISICVCHFFLSFPHLLLSIVSSFHSD